MKYCNSINRFHICAMRKGMRKPRVNGNYWPMKSVMRNKNWTLWKYPQSRFFTLNYSYSLVLNSLIVLNSIVMFETKRRFKMTHFAYERLLQFKLLGYRLRFSFKEKKITLSFISPMIRFLKCFQLIL